MREGSGHQFSPTERRRASDLSRKSLRGEILRSGGAVSISGKPEVGQKPDLKLVNNDTVVNSDTEFFKGLDNEAQDKWTELAYQEAIRKGIEASNKRLDAEIKSKKEADDTHAAKIKLAHDEVIARGVEASNQRLDKEREHRTKREEARKAAVAQRKGMLEKEKAARINELKAKYGI